MESGMGIEKGRRERELETGNVQFIAMSVWAVCCGAVGEGDVVRNPL